MPLPRRSTIAPVPKRKPAKKKKPATPTGRAKRGECLLVTCAPIIPEYVMRDLAETLHGSFLTDPDGRYFQIVAVRIDERTRKIYGKCQEMYEAAPYMFAPV